MKDKYYTRCIKQLSEIREVTFEKAEKQVWQFDWTTLKAAFDGLCFHKRPLKLLEHVKRPRGGSVHTRSKHKQQACSV